MTAVTLLKVLFIDCDRLHTASKEQRAAAARVSARWQELYTYLSNNFDALINYGHRYRSGLAISSSRAEGCVDDIGNARMGKRRRMRWSPKGAHRVAVTRAAILDGRLSTSPPNHQLLPTPCLAWLAVTFGLGAGFLGLEINEFLGLIADGAGPDRSGFPSAYFALVGTHSLHDTAGLIWMAVAAAHIALRSDTPRLRGDFDRLATFWHLVGIVWIVIYSVVFLPAMMA